MEIIGNGIDIVQNLKIKKLIVNKKFLKRIYSNYEINYSKKIRNKTNYFAKRFAAKEAFVKSLGIGFRNGINFNDISVINKSSGKPEIHISNKVKEVLKKKLKIKSYKIFLSLSDHGKYSIAFVIINKIK